MSDIRALVREAGRAAFIGWYQTTSVHAAQPEYIADAVAVRTLMTVRDALVTWHPRTISTIDAMLAAFDPEPERPASIRPGENAPDSAVLIAGGEQQKDQSRTLHPSVISEPDQAAPKIADPVCYLCGDPESMHTKNEADWRTVPGCSGYFTPPLPQPSSPAVTPSASATEVCQKCGLGGAVLENWGGAHDWLSLARNPSLIQLWCRRCVLTAQVAYSRKVTPHLKEAERELAALDQVGYHGTQPLRDSEPVGPERSARKETLDPLTELSDGQTP